MMFARVASELEPTITKFSDLGLRAPAYLTDTLLKLHAHSRAPGLREGQSPYADEDDPRYRRMAKLKDEFAQRGERLSDKKAAETAINDEDKERENPRDSEEWHRDVAATSRRTRIRR